MELNHVCELDTTCARKVMFLDNTVSLINSFLLTVKLSEIYISKISFLHYTN